MGAPGRPARRLSAALAAFLLLTLAAALAPQAAQAQQSCAPLVAPTISVAAAGPGQLTVTWTLSSYQENVDNWNLQYRKTGGSWTTVPISNAAARSHTITGLEAGTAYQVQLRAILQATLCPPGPTSTTATATTSGTAGTPVLTAKAGDGQVTLFYYHPGGSIPSNNAWSYKIIGTSINQEFLSSLGKTSGSYTVTSLQNGRAYTFEVEYVGSGGIQTSNQVTVTPNPPPPPVLISDPDKRVKAGTGGTVVVCYNLLSVSYDGTTYLEKRSGRTAVPAHSALKDTTNGVSITEAPAVISAQVLGTGNINFDPCATVGPGTHTVTWEWNGPGGTASKGTTSTTFTVVPHPSTVPAKPTEVRARSEDGTVSLFWRSPADNRITGWKFRRKAADDDNWGSWTTIGSITSSGGIDGTNLGGLTNGTVYVFQIRATSANGDGAVSDTVAARPMADPSSVTATVAPAKPAKFRATGGNGEVTLRWADPEDGSITRWEYQQKSGSGTFGSDWTLIAEFAYVSDHRITGLQNGTKYTFRVRAVNSIGNGAVSDEASATPQAKTIALTASSTTVAEGDSGHTDITITATLSEGAPANFEVILGWDTVSGTATLQDSNDCSSPSDIDVCFVGDTSIAIAAGERVATRTLRVLGDTRYEDDETAYILAYASGVSGWTGGRLILTIVDDDDDQVVAPAAPTGFTATAGNGQVVLNWSDPDDATITGYQYQQKTGGNFGATWTAMSGSGASTTSYTVGSLTNGTEYTFRIRAVSAAGNGAVSDEKSATPVAAPTAGVTVSTPTLTVDEGGSGTYTMRLNTAPSDTVTVTVGGASGDVTVEPASLTFTTTNYADPQTVTVRAGRDEDTDTDTNVTLTHGASGGGYGSVTIASVVVSVTDTTPTLQLRTDPEAVTEGTAIALTVTSNRAVPGTLPVRLTLADRGSSGFAAADLPGGLGPRTFNAAFNGGTTGTVTIATGRDSDTDEGPETYRITLNDAAGYAVGTDVTADGTLNDGPAPSTGGGGSVTVRDTAPDFGDGSAPDLDLTSGEAMAPVVLPRATGGNGAFTYTLTSVPPGLAGLVFDPATRRLSGTPSGNGRYTFTYRADDGDGNRRDEDAAILTFTVIVEDGRTRLVKQTVRRTLAEVARRALTGALDNIGARLAAAPLSGLTLAGETVPLDMSGADAGTGLGTAGRACTSGAPWRQGLGRTGAGAPGCGGPEPRSVESDELLNASAFSLALGAAEDAPDFDPHAPRWAVWGRGDYGTFAGRPEGMRYEGELRTGWLGVDARAGAWVAGLAVSHGRGEADYDIDDGQAGRLETELTALYPYGRWTVSEGLELRGVLGAGRGEARHRGDGGAEATGDLTMRMASAGLRYDLPPLAGVALAARADASAARMETDAGPAPVHGLTAESWRLRAGVEASRRLALDDATALTPFVEAAARRDGGDGLTGTGLEVAGGVRWTAPRVQVEARGRWLAAHTEAGAEERGVSVTARVGPGAEGRGLSLMLRPRWGAGTSGAEALWRDALPTASTADPAAALDARIGYGLGAAPWGLVTPFAETGLAGDGRRLRLGTRLDASHRRLGVELAGEHREGGAAGPEQAVRLDLRLRY